MRISPAITTDTLDPFRYKIHRVDTNVIHCVYGNHGEPDFRRWDSTTFIAYVVLPNLPLQYDTVDLHIQFAKMIEQNNWTELFAFRDGYSVYLFALSSGPPVNELRRRGGFIGRFPK